MTEIRDVIGSLRSQIFALQRKQFELASRLAIVEAITDAPEYQQVPRCEQPELPLGPQED